MILRGLLSFFVLVVACLAQDAARMDEVVQSYVSKGEFMGSVLVARGGDVLFSKSYGSANLEWDIPNTPATKFRLGSITKQFTAASVLLLEERGKLKIEDAVKIHLPDAPAAWEKITIFHLLTHTSGIPSFTEFSEYPRMKLLDTPAEQVVAKFRDRPLEFEPGEKMAYSNSGYLLLGYLVEKVSGQGYAEFVQENIFTPLGMKDSGYDSNSVIIPRRASGYAPSPGGPVNAAFIHMSIPHGAGALYSTTEDLLRWEQALFGGKLLTAESLRKMVTPFKGDYGLGLLIKEVEGHKRIWHGGGIEGFNTSLAYYPESKITAVVLANLNGRTPDQLSQQLGKLAHGEAVQLTAQRQEIRIPRETLAAYVGTYELTPQIKLMMTLDGGQLMTQLSGQPKFPVFAESETEFFLKVVDAQLTFVKGDKGAVTEAILHQNGRDQTARRISDSVAERQEVPVAPEILESYVGSYEMRPGVDMVVTVEQGKLITKLGAQPNMPLFAESETSFFSKTVDARIEFVKDESGAVTALVLHQGPNNVRAPRK
jgi:CubicO group peptidase (beta-lactamase class C family)